MRIDDAAKIARTLVAFANTDGGRLLIGVKDNGAVTGANQEEEYHMIDLAAGPIANWPSLLMCKSGRSKGVRSWKSRSPVPPAARISVKTKTASGKPTCAGGPHSPRQPGPSQGVAIRNAHGPLGIPVRSIHRKTLQRLARRSATAVCAGGPRARLRYEDAEDLLCLLIVWNIIEWERGACGLRTSWPMPRHWMSWRPVAPRNSDGKIIRDPNNIPN